MQHEPVDREHHMKVAVCAPFDRIDPAYSLTHVVSDQLTMLIRAGHRPVLFVRRGEPFRWFTLPNKRRVPVKQVFAPYGERVEVGFTSDAIVADLIKFPVIFTHDLISHVHNKEIADALAVAAPRFTHHRFYHWIHSLPGPRQSWWDLNRYGLDHFLVYPNCTHAPLAADQFMVNRGRVKVIPHPVDLRSLFQWDRNLWNIVDTIPGLLSADIVQVYPAAADRLASKGVRDLIRFFGALKDQGVSVCCLIVDSWTGKLPREDRTEYEKLRKTLDLDQTEVVFMSEIYPGFISLTRKQVASLMQLSNLIAFPTVGEAFGLVLAEAILAGGAFPVTNSTTPNTGETVGNNGETLDFKSAPKSIFGRSIHTTIRHILESPASKARNLVRKRYNLDAVYQSHYAPLLKG